MGTIFVGTQAQRAGVAAVAKRSDWYLATDSLELSVAFADGAFTEFPTQVLAPSSVRGFISGLLPANAADADHDISFGVGRCISADGMRVLNFTGALVKQLDAGWAVGNNAGGLFSGSVAADTTYHGFIIRRDSDGVLDAGFDTSLTAANIPSGYTQYRRCFSLKTDPSSNIRPFKAIELADALKLLYTDPPLDVDDASSSDTGETRTLAVPGDLEFEAVINVYAAEVHRISSMDQDNEAVNVTSAPLPNVPSDQPVQVTEWTNTSGQVRSRAEAGQGGATLRMSTQAYLDGRRK